MFLMIKKHINIFFSLIIACLALSSCADDLLLDPGQIGEGEAIVSANIHFHPLVATDVSTASRAAGNALSDLDDIKVFVYSVSNAKLVNIYSGDDLIDLKTTAKDQTGANTDMPSAAGEKAEETTATASFSLKGLPYGTYYMYVTANIPFTGMTDDDMLTKFERVENLRKYTVEWNEDDISANDQMFGYFCNEGTEDDNGLDAAPVAIDSKMVSLHAWVKRCASKVTVAFDGSGLHDDIWIYIKDVRIRDIPKYCHIGQENWVKTVAGGGDPSLHSDDSQRGDSLIALGGVLYYNSAGVTASDPGNDYTKWLSISNGSGIKGAVSTDASGQTVTHSEYDDALYFYENLQGNYDGDSKYLKHQDKEKIGTMPKAGEDDYKDNVPYGTYIEVEAYYLSQNPEELSEGRIIYRFMLGQDVDYDYNAYRNHHYKVTLGFKGWANQPDWHIAYIEPENTIFTNPTYYVSYKYNTQAFFPIRLIGDVTKLEVEIVENNWAPYDSTSTYNVPAATIASAVTGEPDFAWNRTVYINNDGNNYYYGLKNPWNTAGTSQLTSGYSDYYRSIGAPDKVTAIWAGFLALQVPDNLEAILLSGSSYSTQYVNLKNYFYNISGGFGKQQNYRSIDIKSMNLTNGMTKTDGSGNNACEVTKAEDGSITVNLPMWTRPKSMLGISGFSGNNPYDTYQRKAMVRITATYSNGRTITRFRPVYQARRIVNPKAVWRQWNNNESFHVQLMQRNGATSSSFTAFESQGAWRAHVSTWSAGDDRFITLTGGNAGASAGYIYGDTDTPVDFYIRFNGMGSQTKSMCAVIEIEYNGLTCHHTIFVRQGYNEPLAISSGGAKWSSFSLFKTNSPVTFGTTWNENTKNYIPAQLTVSPLSLGTLFRRGNYNGILVWNNSRTGLGVNQYPGSTKFKMSDSDISKIDSEAESDGVWQAWADIQGYPYGKNFSGKYSAGTIQRTYAWGRFSVTENGQTRHYRVPTYDDYNALMTGCDFGVGIMYGDAANETASNIADAYGFFDANNDGVDDNQKDSKNVGMRGILVYNPSNANQIFFPIGYRGMGRRTIQGFSSTSAATELAKYGELRYSSVTYNLTQEYNNGVNEYRPIPFNMLGATGAIYWLSAPDNDYLGWDMNYFDQNFNAYDYAMSYAGYGANADTHGGDAVPIKLVLDE